MAKKLTVAVVGLGYVGLPLAVEFGQKKYHVIGYDYNAQKIKELKAGVENMGEVDPKELGKAKLDLTTNPKRLKEADVIIVAVPTPVDAFNTPDMSILHAATAVAGRHMKKGAIVTFESTVYPGATEDECVPILEEESGLKFGRDFTVGYSPERVNPGDKNHTIPKIIKVVSASDPATLKILSQLYGSVVTAGIHEAPNIKTAEASKVIENCQRDINIALMNELSIICQKLGIRTMDVIDAATTKWNIHRYTPGLVGGHCIGVDPYYLVHKAKQLGIHTEVLTAGRRLNDSMPIHAAHLVIEGLIEADRPIKNARVMVMGLTFKENVKDTRNAKITKTIEELQRLKVHVIGHDPLIDEADLHEYPDIEFVKELPNDFSIDAAVLAAGHREFASFNQKRFSRLFQPNLPVVVDVRSFFQPSIVGVDGIYKSL
ncbi:MAG TPA: nucleotide sugar dehydrogenase [Candidatus Saccharimonadales bacterium]|nr:nucleotide sugar dehydrogenase [Candidatus Saccharimonadales bacterium]